MANQCDTFGILLAAGRGSRMGQPKALLRWKEKSFLEHIAHTQQQAGVRATYIVTQAALIEQLAPHAPTHCIWVEGTPQESQIDSLLRALQAIPNDRPTALLIGPVDQGPYPLRLLQELQEGFVSTSEEVRIPTYQKKSGHPVLLGAGFVPKLRSHPEGLRGLFEDHSSCVRPVEVTAVATLRNLNTHEQYERFQQHTHPLEELFAPQAPKRSKSGIEETPQ